MKKIIITGCTDYWAGVMGELIDLGMLWDEDTTIVVQMDAATKLEELLKDKNTWAIFLMTDPKDALQDKDLSPSRWSIIAEHFLWFRKHQRVIPIRSETLRKIPSVVQNEISKLGLQKIKSFEKVFKEQDWFRGCIQNPRTQEELEEAMNSSNVLMLSRRLDYE